MILQNAYSLQCVANFHPKIDLQKFFFGHQSELMMSKNF